MTKQEMIETCDVAKSIIESYDRNLWNGWGLGVYAKDELLCRIEKLKQFIQDSGE